MFCTSSRVVFEKFLPTYLEVKTDTQMEVKIARNNLINFVEHKLSKFNQRPFRRNTDRFEIEQTIDIF